MMRFCINRHCHEPAFREGPMCHEHGCHVCGGIMLADSEDWEVTLCPTHFEQLEARFETNKQWKKDLKSTNKRG